MTDIILELRGLLADERKALRDMKESGAPNDALLDAWLKASGRLNQASNAALPALLDRLEAAERKVAADWQPRVGEEIRLTNHFLDQYPEWRDGSRFWCAGISKDRTSGYPVDGLNVTLSEEWPPHRKTGGFTDGFYIARAGVPDDIEPVPAIDAALVGEVG